MDSLKSIKEYSIHYNVQKNFLGAYCDADFLVIALKEDPAQNISSY